MIVKIFFMDVLTQAYGHVTEQMRTASASRMESYISTVLNL
jgi:hypothetical protein